MSEFSLAALALVWAAAAAAVAFFRTRDRQGTVGLVLTYIVNFALLHWLGAVIYVLPWHHFHNPDVVKRGLEVSTYAMLAFALGSLSLGPFLAAKVRWASSLKRSYMAGAALKFGLLGLGWLATLAMLTPVRKLPTISAVVSATGQLVIVGLCLGLRDAWLRKRWDSVALWLAAGAILPLFTMLSLGFLGFGALPLFCFFCFLVTLARRRTLLLILLTASSFLWLSFFVTYMRDRKVLRRTVWGGQEYSQRFDRITHMIATFEWFDPHNAKHLDRIDERLDQDYLVGSAVNQAQRTGQYAHGQTIFEAFVALVPRILWPDKPVRAGSGDLVSQYTGITFAAGTSVGVGHVLEFYINYGVPGVIVGFLLLGTALSAIDVLARRKLDSGEFSSFTLLFVLGISLLNVGGSLVELTATAASSALVVWALNQFMNKRNAHRSGSWREARTPQSISRAAPGVLSGPSAEGFYGEPQ